VGQRQSEFQQTILEAEVFVGLMAWWLKTGFAGASSANRHSRNKTDGTKQNRSQGRIQGKEV